MLASSRRAIGRLEGSSEIEATMPDNRWTKARDAPGFQRKGRQAAVDAKPLRNSGIRDGKGAGAPPMSQIDDLCGLFSCVLGGLAPSAMSLSLLRTTTAILAAACASPKASPPVSAHPSLAPAGFWDHWGDGRAEIDVYRLTTPRYGELRAGEAVHVFVTETFTHAQRVKSDGGHDDEYPVIKLNESRDFTTGIYDYNVMTSAFVRLDGGAAWGAPTKVTFSAQEWCGQTWEQHTIDGPRDRVVGHSYFDGEADQDAVIDLPPSVWFEDAAPIWVRGLAGEVATSGLDVAVVPRAMDTRFAHRPLTIAPATLTVGAPEPVTVPFGTFEARPIAIARADGAGATWWVEVAPPHRIVRWTRTDGEVADLVGSQRTAYWQENSAAFESRRGEIGLPPRQWPTPETNVRQHAVEP
jgi:hypothetical protein